MESISHATVYFLRDRCLMLSGFLIFLAGMKICRHCVELRVKKWNLEKILDLHYPIPQRREVCAHYIGGGFQRADIPLGG